MPNDHYVNSRIFLIQQLHRKSRQTDAPHGFLIFSGGRERVHWEQMS